MPLRTVRRDNRRSKGCMIMWTYTTRPADPTDRTPEHPEATEVLAWFNGGHVRSVGVWSLPHQAQDVADKPTQWGGRQLR